MKKKYLVCLLVLAVGCVLSSGCIVTTQKVYIKQAHYSPRFSADLRAYRGMRVYLMNVVNQANDTTIWYYYSPKRKFTYEGAPTLQSYFWYSFNKALMALGMRVSRVDNPDPNAPAVQFTMRSISDRQFVFHVEIQKRGVTTFQKGYTIAEPPLPPAMRNVANLEARAYRMITRTIEVVFGDRAFKRAFWRASPRSKYRYRRRRRRYR